MLLIAASIACLNAQCPVPAGATKFSYSGSSPANSVTAGTASTSASTITVPASYVGTISSICVDLNGVTSSVSAGAQSLSNAYIFLAVTPAGGSSPSNGILLLGSTGDGIDGDDTGDAGSGLQGVTISIADGAAPAPDGSLQGTVRNVWPQTGSLRVAPSSYSQVHGYGSPPLGESSEWPASDGAATFANQILGAAAAGTWTLSIIDNNPATGGDPVTVGSWDMVITPSAFNGTATTIVSSLNPSWTSAPDNSVTLTAEVNVPASAGGSVSFTDNGASITGCAAVGLTANGSISQATCNTMFSTEGSHPLAASYTPGAGFSAGSSTILYQFASSHSTVTGSQYCNPGAISFSTSAAGLPGSPYPSLINVGTDTAALAGSIATITVTLNGLQGSGGVLGSEFLLVGPDGVHNLDFLSGAGTSGSAQPAVSVSIADNNSPAPQGSALLSATYTPTDNNIHITGEDVFLPAPALVAPQVPATILHAATDGSATLTGEFGGRSGDGNWALFANGNGGPMSVSGGWCLGFTLAGGTPTSTQVISSLDPALSGSPVTFTATVTTGSPPRPVTAGTVTFTENGAAPAGVAQNTVSLNAAGQASIATSALGEGDHKITAAFNGGGGLTASSKFVWQRVDNPTSAGNLNANPVTFCNPGTVALAAGATGAATPNPSNIFVAGLAGTINSVSVELTNFEMPSGLGSLASLVVGPGESNASTIDFFSGVGTSGASAAAGNYVFTDSAERLAPASGQPLEPGAYLPTSYDPSDAFTASPSTFQTLPPGPYNYAAAAGSATLAGVFGGGNANGVWSLYFNLSTDVPALSGAEGGWCLTFDQNAPDLALASTNSPGSFVRGDAADSIAFTIHNNGPGPSGGTLTLAETVPSGLTVTALSGSGWSCPSALPASAGTVSCTSSAAIPAGQDYPPVTATVSVAANAPASVTDTASISGSLDNTPADNTASDVINVAGLPNLAITITPAGSFTQGLTAEWDVAISNSAAAAGVTAGLVTMQDALPAGYTVNAFTGTDAGAWSCSGAGTAAATCTTEAALAGGAAYPLIHVIVNVPANSPVSVSDTALVFGGGDPNHANAANAAMAASAVTVSQVAASVTITGGGTETTLVNTPFGVPLTALVEDAAGVAIPSYTVTFAAPGSGASGVFSNSSNVISGTTNAAGQVSEAFTANGTLGAYAVTAVAGPAGANPPFLLNNVASGVTVALPPAIAQAFGSAAAGVGGTVGLTFSITNPSTTQSLTGIGFTDNLPAGLVVAASPNVGNSCGGAVSAPAGSSAINLVSGSLGVSASCSISLTLAATSPGTVDNVTGAITSVQSGAGATSNTASLQILQAPTVAEQFGSASIVVNATTALSFTFANPSATEFVDVGLNDALPAGLAVAGAGGASGSCVPDNGASVIAEAGATSVTIFDLTLAPHASCSVTVSVTGLTAGAKNNTTANLTASFDAGAGMFVGINGSAAAASLAVIQPPAISAIFDPALITAGETSILTFSVSNPAANPVALSGVGFTASLPSGLTVSSSNSSACGGTVSVNPVTGIILSGGSLATGTQCQFSVDVTGAAAGNYIDTTGPVVSANAGTGNPASANLTVEPAATSGTTASTVSVSPGSVSFSYSTGSASAKLTQLVTVSTPGPFVVAASVAPGAPWLSASAAGATVSVTAEAAGLGAGTYQGTVSLAISGVAAAVNVPVTLTVAGEPALVASATSLSFSANASAGQSTAAPAPQSVQLSAENGNVQFQAASASAWLSVTASASNTPATLTVSVNPGSMPVGTYAGSLEITAAGASNSPLSIPVTLNIASSLVTTGSSAIFENSASGLGAAGAVNTIMALFGHFTCGSALSVLVNGGTVGLVGSTASLVTFTLPSSVTGSSATVAVECDSVLLASATLDLAAASPGIYTLAMTGSGQGAVVNQDGTVNGASHPAPLNTYISVYGTGFGAYLAPSSDGLTRLRSTVQAFIGGATAEVEFAGQAPDSTPGLQQINVLIPPDAPVGAAVPVQLVVDGLSTQTGVTVAIAE